MNERLKRAITTQMRTISDVRGCFYYCETADDIREVIKTIPAEFGEFDILKISERERYFVIHNLFKVEGETKSRTMAYDFYITKN